MNKTNVAQQNKTASFLPSTQGLLQRKCTCGSHTTATNDCTECAKKKSGLQRHSAGNVGAFKAPPSVYDAIHSTGQPLDKATRDRMESMFGHDLSRVRIHTEARAALAAKDIHAHAFTVGNDIIFDTAKYAPQTLSGQRLLAHELTHVIQQSGGTKAEGNPSSASASDLHVTEPGDRFEREAEAVANSLSQVTPRNIRTFSLAPTSVLAPAGCVSDYFNLTAAALSAVGACGGAIALFLTPEPTTLTKWAALAATVGCLGAISWIISAMLSLIECKESDPDADREEIERLRRRVEFLEERRRELEERVGE